ncbi:hypothetical protein [Haloquadratum walsbyi]|jgi:hypothetical protein|uniref:Uncharacterized protein n=1 Tax=Haloquadratum walsbyi J07HQW2 TaxID=1238425 RepID=U1NFQ2_9EURY|nr:hypothetical protein [Haloquadratum walsbyi]ERG95910.1 MAG: hypothetical protein J07HQW2_02370 [Haloquadratum walsbyi J07HQW2]
MDASDLAATLRDDHETAFSRLGSSKAMYAITNGEMDGAVVRAAAAVNADAVSTVTDAWSESENSTEDHHTDEIDEMDPDTLFTVIATDAGERAVNLDPDVSQIETVTDPQLYDVLESMEMTPSRLGGLLARSLVMLEQVSQMIGFFVGNAEPKTAGEFRDLKSAIESDRDRVITALNSTCDSDTAWERAQSSADAVIDAAYTEYVDSLEQMGIKPKNVC